MIHNGARPIEPAQPLPRRSRASLPVFLLLVAATAVLGATFRPGTWYQSLNKAPWNPPNAVFAPVWTALYVMIAVAGWRVWSGRVADRAILLWTASLVLNALWTPIFFGAERSGLALVDIIALLAVNIAFIRATRPVDRIASLLFVIYSLWVAYATTLTAWVWIFNR